MCILKTPRWQMINQLHLLAWGEVWACFVQHPDARDASHGQVHAAVSAYFKDICDRAQYDVEETLRLVYWLVRSRSARSRRVVTDGLAAQGGS